MLKHSWAKFFQCLSYWPTYLILKLFLHFQIKGQENLRGLKDKSIIFAANHASLIDASMIIVSMPRSRGIFCPDFFPIRSLATSAFKKHPIKNCLAIFYIWIHGSIWVSKAGGRLNIALKETIEALKAREKILIFPEGKRTETGKLNRPRRGVAYLQKETGIPIIPVAITNTFHLLDIKNFFLAFLGIRVPQVIFGKPFILDFYSEKALTLEEGSEIVMKKIKDLVDSVDKNKKENRQKKE